MDAFEMYIHNQNLSKNHGQRDKKANHFLPIYVYTSPHYQK